MPAQSTVRELPTGTVTFMFTDIEGSTRLLEELGADAYERELADHRRLLRDAFTSYGGVEVDTQGDAFFVAFASAEAAATAALKSQERIAAGPIRVRIGLHTGSPRLSHEGYVGHEVHLGARIAAAGHGGQVLLSKQTRDAVGSALDVLDLGEHRVKDFAEPVWLYQLGSESFPPLKTISNTNLPRPASSFVGREREISEITAYLRSGARMLTLTGPGGTGKTRLAIDAAMELVPANRNGVFWVALAALTDPALVAGQIAHALGARDSLAAHVGEREMLLLLDNFEQVVDAAPELSALLSACPNLRILVTSRERLRVQGEVEYAVPPLAEPEAVELFCRRAGVEGDETVAELCRRLDNLPLAVELAAARASVLSPAQILGRLSKRLDLLKGGRDAEVRQQTLRATVEWSHELLTDEEKALFGRLAVFRGGCTLEAAEQVADADLDTLQSLVEKSLMRHSGERFVMLETIREYAAERMDESGEANELARRHAEYFLALAEGFEPTIVAAGGEKQLDLLEADLANLRAAIEWFDRSGRTQPLLRITGALWSFWNRRGHIVEGLRLLLAALDADSQPTAARAKALNAASELTGWTSQPELGRKLAAEAVKLHHSLGDPIGEAWALWGYGMSTAECGDFAAARESLEQSVASLRKAGPEHDRLAVMRSLAWVYEELGEDDLASELYEEGLSTARETGNDEMEATFLGVLAARYAAPAGHHEKALAMLERAVGLWRALGDRLGLMIELSGIARVLSLHGDQRAAALVLSQADAVRGELGVDFEKWNVKMNEATLAAIGAALDETRFEQAWIEGRELSIDEALELARRSIGKSEAEAVQ